MTIDDNTYTVNVTYDGFAPALDHIIEQIAGRKYTGSAHGFDERYLEWACLQDKNLALSIKGNVKRAKLRGVTVTLDTWEPG